MAAATASPLPPPSLQPASPLSDVSVRHSDRFSRRDRTADLVLQVDSVLYYVHRHLLAKHSARIASLDVTQSHWTIQLPVVPDLVGHSGPCLTSKTFSHYLNCIYVYEALRDDQCSRCVLALLVAADFMGSRGLRAQCEYLVGQNYPMSETNWAALLQWSKAAGLSVRIPIAVYTYLYDRAAYTCQFRRLFALDADDFCGVLLLPSPGLSAVERVRLLVQYFSGRKSQDDDDDDDDDDDEGEIVVQSDMMSPEKFCSMVTAMFAVNGTRGELPALRSVLARVRFDVGDAGLNQHWRELLDKMMLSSAVRALIRICTFD